MRDGGLADDDKGPRLQARRKHEPHGLAERGKIAVGDPATKLDLDRSDNREWIEDLGDVPDLDFRRQVRRWRIAQAGDDAQGGAGPQWNLDEMSNLRCFSQVLRQTVGVGLGPRTIIPLRRASGRRPLLDGTVYDDVCIHATNDGCCLRHSRALIIGICRWRPPCSRRCIGRAIAGRLRRPSWYDEAP